MKRKEIDEKIIQNIIDKTTIAQKTVSTEEKTSLKIKRQKNK